MRICLTSSTKPCPAAAPEPPTGSTPPCPPTSTSPPAPATTTDYLLTDPQHSVDTLISPTAAVTGNYSYDAFGNLTASSGTDTALNQLRYTAGYLDPTTGQYDNRARTYDPTQGRFTTTDPLPPSISGPYPSAYSYAGNNPLTQWDPTGQCPWGVPKSWCKAAKKALNKVSDVAYNVLTSGPGKDVSSFLEGVGDFASGGATKKIRDAIDPNSECFVDKNGWYVGGEVVGAIGVSITPGGAEEEIANAANTEEELTTVGRWMSADEHEAMSSTGMVQEGGGGTTYVAHPADPGAYGSQAASGSRYVEFDVPPSSLRPAGKEGWAQIPGPNSLYGRLAQMRGEPIPQFPPALNINWLLTK